MTTPQHEVHTQRTSGPFRLASQTTWKDPYHCCDLSRTCTMSAPSWSGLQLRSSTVRTAHRSRLVRDWPRAPCAAGRCSLKRSAVRVAASRNFTETAGRSLRRLARKCCATWFRARPTIAGRCVCSHISLDSRCQARWRMGSGIGKSCGRNAGRLAASAAIPGSHPRTQERSNKDEFGYFRSNRFIAALRSTLATISIRQGHHQSRSGFSWNMPLHYGLRRGDASLAKVRLGIYHRPAMRLRSGI